MKYCIGCKHLSYEDKSMGAGSTMTGSWTMEEASMACAKGHWKIFLSDYGNRWQFDLEKAMEIAETCKDFQERELPQPEKHE